MKHLITSLESWPLERRRSGLQLDHAETLRCLEAQLRGLWSAEVNSCEGVPSGVSSNTSAMLFDKLSKHTILTSMRLDGDHIFSAAGMSRTSSGEQLRLVEWDFCRNPGALKHALVRTLGKDHNNTQLISKSGWPKLLQLSVQSWAQLEVQVATILAQTVLCAQVVNALQAEVDADVGHALETNRLPVTASKRREKRLSQRLRRTQCRAAKRTTRQDHEDMTAEFEDVASMDMSCLGTHLPLTRRDVTPHLRSHEVNACKNSAIAAWQTKIDFCSPYADVDDREQPHSPILLQQRAWRLAAELKSGKCVHARSIVAAALTNHGASAFSTILSMALDAINTNDRTLGQVLRDSSATQLLGQCSQIWKTATGLNLSSPASATHAERTSNLIPRTGTGLPIDRMQSHLPQLHRSSSTFLDPALMTTAASPLESEKPLSPCAVQTCSRIGTPQMLWPVTPSTPDTPRGHAWDGVPRCAEIPSYITVPVAHADICPNCGGSFGVREEAYVETSKDHPGLRTRIQEPKLQTGAEEISSRAGKTAPADVGSVDRKDRRFVLQSLSSLAVTIDEHLRRLGIVEEEHRTLQRQCTGGAWCPL